MTKIIVGKIVKTNSYKKMVEMYLCLKKHPELFSWFIAFFPPTEVEESSENTNYWNYRDKVWKEKNNVMDINEVTEMYKFGSNLKSYKNNWTPNYKLEEISEGYYIKTFYYTSNFHLSGNRGYFSDEIYSKYKQEEKESYNQAINHGLFVLLNNKKIYYNIKIVQSFFENKIRDNENCNISYSLIIDIYLDNEIKHFKML